jgi:hypothetical protein
MTRFVVGDDRSQSTLFPERLDDYLGEDNPDPRSSSHRNPPPAAPALPPRRTGSFVVTKAPVRNGVPTVVHNPDLTGLKAGFDHI